DALIILASERLKGADPTGALTLIDRGLQKNPRSLGLQYLKVNALDALGDLEGIEAVLKQLFEDNPHDPPFRTGLASFYVQQDRFNDAETLLRDHVVAHPDDAGAQLELVAFLKANRGLSAARHELDALVVKNPQQFSYRMALAEILLASGEDTGAITLLNAIIDSDTENDERNQARLQLSRVLVSTGNRQRALTLVDAVLDGDSKNVDALEIKARLYLADGQIREAVSYLLAVRNEAPDSGSALLLLADAYERLGSVELAEEQ
ncbi:MAG: tetratricopeptide repeat protein, partial [bacterium]|nr:tetratricopeptide repeat protein [bacterium]